MYILTLFNATVYSRVYFCLSGLIQLSMCRFAVQLVLLNNRIDDLEIFAKDNNYDIYNFLHILDDIYEISKKCK